MFRKQRRKVYRRIRFQTWYRKACYYHRKRDKLDDYIAKFCGEDALKDERRRARLRRDMKYCLLKYGSYYDEYFLFGFEGQDEKYRSSFITEGIRMSYYPRMNSPKNTNMLENKYSTYRKFRDMFKRDMICIRAHDPITPESAKAFRDFISKHESYVVKPTYASMGHGVRIESILNYPTQESAWNAYHAAGVVLEEIIRQDDRMAVLHPQSVNTLRIPTVVIKNARGDDEVRLYNPTLRVGQHGSVIDNTSAGGISVIIDPETGVLSTDGADKRGQHYETHPDTGVRFRGFQIPDWADAVEMVKKAALMVPGNRYCGWDLALYEGRGWCMVEANCTAQMSGMQFVPRIGRKNELEALISKM